MRKWYKFHKESGQMVRMDLEAPVEVHGVIQDTIEPTISYATKDKQIFTSRSKLLAHYAQHGFKCTGGDHLLKRDKDETDESYCKRYYESILFEGNNERDYMKMKEAEVAKTAEKAYFDVKYGRVQFSDAQKEQHLREQRRLGKAWTLKAPY